MQYAVAIFAGLSNHRTGTVDCRQTVFLVDATSEAEAIGIGTILGGKMFPPTTWSKVSVVVSSEVFDANTSVKVVPL